MTALPLRSSDAVERVALAGALLPVFIYGIGGNYENPNWDHFTALIAAIVGLTAVILRREWGGAWTLLTVLCVSLREHAIQGDHRASDVLLSTNEAIGVLFGGGNPYTHTYAMTNPPGSPFGYPPGEIIFYSFAHLFGGNVFRVDLACSILGLGVIAAFVPFCGAGLASLAVSAIGFAGDLNFHLTDGSNDNAAAFLVLIGFAALVWSPSMKGRSGEALWWISAIAFGWALAFKEYSAPIVFFVALSLWRTDAKRARGWLTAMLGTGAAFIVPFLVWNPFAFIGNVGGALITHQYIWGRNVWHDWVGLIPNGTAIAPLVPFVMLLCVIALGVLLWRHPARTMSDALLQGLAVVAITFLMARWTTSVYYAFLAPLVVSAVALKLGSETIAPDDYASVMPATTAAVAKP
jgi:hypothetical protein